MSLFYANLLQLKSTFLATFHHLFTDIGLIGELCAILDHRPTWIRARQLLDINFARFMTLRALSAILALLYPIFWSLYIRIDALFYILAIDGYGDLFAVCMGLFFILYVDYLYQKLFYVKPLNQIALNILYDLLKKVYKEDRTSEYFPEVPKKRIKQQISLAINLINLGQPFVRAALAMAAILLTFDFVRLHLNVLLTEHPQIFIDILTLIYLGNTLLHLHIFLATIIFIVMLFAKSIFMFHVVKMGKIAHSLELNYLNSRRISNDKRRSSVYAQDLRILRRRLQLETNFAYQRRNFDYIHRCNGLISPLSLSYVCINLINPSCLLCYLNLKAHLFSDLLFNLIWAFLVGLMITVPVLYLLYSEVNRLLGPPRRVIPIIQFHIMGRHNVAFKLLVQDYYEHLSCSRRRPGITIGPSSIATKAKALRIALMSVAYFLYIWRNFTRFHRDHLTDLQKSI